MTSVAAILLGEAHKPALPPTLVRDQETPGLATYRMTLPGWDPGYMAVTLDVHNGQIRDQWVGQPYPSDEEQVYENFGQWLTSFDGIVFATLRSDDIAYHRLPYLLEAVAALTREYARLLNEL